MAGVWREYSPAVVFSIVLHGAMVVAVFLAAQISLKRPLETIRPLALDAVVIDARTLRGSEPAPAPAPVSAPAPTPVPVAANPAPPAPPPAPLPSPKTEAPRQPDAAAQAKAAHEAQAAAAALAQQRLAEQQALAAKAAAEEQRAAEALKVLEAKKTAELRAKSDREAELRRQLAEEEHVHEIESGPLSASYYAILQARMTRSWIKPPTAGPGVDCRVEVTQVPGGEVVGARVTQCNGDAAVRQSIENAVYRASPLPDPPDPALFHRVFVFEFKPNE
jgi:colicin import membrane protein